MNAQVRAEGDAHLGVFGLKGVENDRDVVLDVAGGHQQHRQGGDAAEALLPQSLQRLGQVGFDQFQKPGQASPVG